MSTKIENKSFLVVGMEARTTNAAESGPNGIIPSVWGKFMQENMMEKIPHKIDGAIIAGYTDYQSNKDGEYTFFLGAKVNSVGVIPPGMTTKEVPAGKYLVMTSDKGPGWKVVYALWQKIWSMPDETRAYKFDYEVYDQRAMDPNNAEVDIYLGIKNE